MKLVHHVSLWTKFIDTHWLTVQSVSCFQSSAISNNRLVHHFKTVKYTEYYAATGLGCRVWIEFNVLTPYRSVLGFQAQPKMQHSNTIQFCSSSKIGWKNSNVCMLGSLRSKPIRFVFIGYHIHLWTNLSDCATFKPLRLVCYEL